MSSKSYTKNDLEASAEPPRTELSPQDAARPAAGEDRDEADLDGRREELAESSAGREVKPAAGIGDDQEEAEERERAEVDDPPDPRGPRPDEDLAREEEVEAQP